MSGPLNPAAVSSNNPIEDLGAPVESEKCLQWITYSMTKDALTHQTNKQKGELEKLKVSVNFLKQLNSLRSAVKPNGTEKLVIGEDLKKQLAALKNYPEKVREELNGRDLPENVKQEMIASAKALADRVTNVVTNIEKDNLTAETRKDIKEDIDTLIKETSEDNSMQLNSVTRIMNTLHEMYAMARSIVRTVHETIKNFLRKIDPR